MKNRYPLVTLYLVLVLVVIGTAQAQSYIPGGGNPPAPRAVCVTGVLDIRSTTDSGAPLWTPAVYFAPIGPGGRLGTPVLLTFDHFDDYVEAVHADGHVAKVRGVAVSPTVFRVAAILIGD